MKPNSNDKQLHSRRNNLRLFILDSKNSLVSMLTRIKESLSSFASTHTNFPPFIYFTTTAQGSKPEHFPPFGGCIDKKSQSFSRPWEVRSLADQHISLAPTRLQAFELYLQESRKRVRAKPFPAFFGGCIETGGQPFSRQKTDTYCTVKVCSSSSSKCVNFFLFFFRVMRGVFGSMVNIFLA